jgi:hypothetical protein
MCVDEFLNRRINCSRASRKISLDKIGLIEKSQSDLPVRAKSAGSNVDRASKERTRRVKKPYPSLCKYCKVNLLQSTKARAVTWRCGSSQARRSSVPWAIRNKHANRGKEIIKEDPTFALLSKFLPLSLSVYNGVHHWEGRDTV